MHKTSSESGSQHRSVLVTSLVIVGVTSAVLLLLVRLVPTTGALLLSIGLLAATLLACAYMSVRDAATPAVHPADTRRDNGIVIDDSDARRKLEEMRAQLVQSEKMASLGELTAGIAHEINNPINFVSANVRPLQRDIATVREVLDRYVELHDAQLQGDTGIVAALVRLRQLREELELDYVLEEIDQLIRGIEDGARRTAEIVRGLRNFSRLDDRDLRRVDVHDGIDSTLVLLHNATKDRIEITREYGRLPEIECYPGQLNQVFMNLLTNAVQAIDGPGTISIRTSHEENVVRIAIADTGSGIPESVRERIFDPFFTTKEVGKGTGLGLSISLDIIARHYGMISVDSQAGGGTTFTVTLPVDHQETPQPAVPATNPTTRTT